MDEAIVCRHCHHNLINNVDKIFNLPQNSKKRDEIQSNLFSEEMLNDIYRKWGESYLDVPENAKEIIAKFQKPLLETIIFPTISQAFKPGRISLIDKQEIETFIVFKANQMGYLCFYTGFESTQSTINDNDVPYYTFLFSYYYCFHVIQIERRLLPSRFINSTEGSKFISAINDNITNSAVKLALEGTFYKNSGLYNPKFQDITPFQQAIVELGKLIKDSL